METNPRILAAALLWLRNHFEFGQPELKAEVLRRIDRVLGTDPVEGKHDNDLSIIDMNEFRNKYPREASSGHKVDTDRTHDEAAEELQAKASDGWCQ